jgi:uncharacterized protein YbaA (DUF1428 family)
MAYVDAYVLPLPKANVEAYRAMALKVGTIWREHGALEYREALADDVQSGQFTSFPQSVQLKDDELVVVSWIVFRSRDQRDEVNAKVMVDARLKEWLDSSKLPFDGKRMFWGGFEIMMTL